MHYIPITEQDEKNMLAACNIDSFSELIKIIPSKLRIEYNLGIGLPLSELEIENELQEISSNNNSNRICYLGRGIYDHYIPKSVDFICNRSEFSTAYTPYQPEVSQGTLQYLYEYQSMICELSGMDIANASLYDGASAIAEACMIAISETGERTILYSSTLSKHFIEVIKTCLSGKDIILIEIPRENGLTKLDHTTVKYKDNIAAMIIQSPNTFGLIENWAKAKENLLNTNALLIAVSDPISLAVLKTPKESGADIYVGDGQVLGNYMNFGGPLLGIIAVKERCKRRMPGRIVGKTIDKNGKDGFVLTLQTREQHIRREKATSNICTNQGLLALRAAIYMSLMGKYGIIQVAKLCYQKSHYTANQINNLPSYSLKYSKHFLKEFVIETMHNVKDLTQYCAERDILIHDINNSTNNCFQVAVTEKRTKQEIDKLIKCLKNFK